MRVFLILLFILRTSSGFLTSPEDDTPGRCIWYDQCGPGFNPNTHLNCPATNTTRHGHVMKSARGLKILKQYCPNIYKGEYNTRSCCSESQLVTLESLFPLPQQLLSRCPSCRENFLNFFCQTTCGLNQADFMWPDMGAPYPLGYKYSPKGIPAVTVLLTREYAEGFFNSCKDVSLPSANDKAISLFCGRPAKDCTASTLLNYLGNPANGRAAFPIKYIIQDRNMTMPDNTTISPLVGKNRPCNATSDSSKSCRVCSCRDCADSCCPGQNPYTQFDPSGHHDYFHSQFRLPFRRSQMVISRPGNDSKVSHINPPPYTGVVNFTAVFDLKFMHQVLEFQRNLTTIPVPYNGTTFTFEDICLRPAVPRSQGCAVESVLQYWQNNATKLDKIAWDEYHIFNLADYLDHFLSCILNPYAEMDATKLNMSCIADYGEAMKPMDVLSGFDGVNYQNATAFVISYYLETTNDDQRARADAWDEAIRKYMCTCPTTNIGIALWP